MEPSMFDTLLSLPLFQGLGHDDLTRILESTHLNFETLPIGQEIVRQDSPCAGVTFILKGKVSCQTEAADRSWNVVETMQAPLVIGLDTLYGSKQTYPHSFLTSTQVRLLRVDKRTIAALTGYFEVFRINVLNTLSAKIARQQQPLWLPSSTTLEGRIIHFMRTHVTRPAGHKTFNMTLRMLGSYLGEDYRYVSKALHHIEELGLVELRRNSIDIAAFESLLQAKL